MSDETKKGVIGEIGEHGEVGDLGTNHPEGVPKTASATATASQPAVKTENAAVTNANPLVKHVTS